MSPIAPLKRAVKSTIFAVSHWRLPSVEPTAIRTFPHDPEAFTQGLAYDQGMLYESCGSHINSSLICRRVADWSIQRVITIPNEFAEGIAICNCHLYQISWKSQLARVYSLPELRQIGTLPYRGEGWGLCSCNGGMLMSNGTGTLTFRDKDFREVRTLRVTQNRFPTRRLNDLEFVQDSIYANVLFRSDILEISATSGRVSRIIDCSALKKAVSLTDTEHVLNGICYNPDDGTFFVTGKCWNLMFEIRIPSRDALRD